MSLADTIVALATPAGESAIGIVRLSGDFCDSLPASIFKLPSPTPRTAHLATYRNVSGDALDQAVFVYYERNRSYTGQPSLEIFCHGNPLILRKVVDDLLARGCRLAQPGEFTRLAFVSGKMELVQAEAVATLINARSERALEVASRHLSGETGRRINYLRDQILAIMAQLEVHVDFPQEDLPQENADGVIENLELLSGEMAKAAETGKYAHLLESGVRTLIVGEPNAGKSSLFNTLCGKNRVIVSDQPGTTRDYVSERLHLGSFEIELIDTAGLRSEASGIELTGMERTLKLIHRVDFFLLTMDATTQSPTLPDELLELIGPKNCILVENKIDLPEATKSKGFLPEIPCVQISALTGEGLDTLNLLWEDTLQNTVPCPAVDALIVNSRHAERLWFAHSALQKATDLLRSQAGVELALSEIRMATEALGEIVGDVDNEDMLDRLFQTFCIGK